VRPRTLLLFALVALLGAAIAVLPALAASSEVTLEVNENCVENNWPCWTMPDSGSNPPYKSKIVIASGATIKFVDHAKAANLAWAGTAPTCSPSVPVSPAAPETGWEGTCKFEQAGTYKFESSTMFMNYGFNYTKYEVVVEAASTPTTTTSTQTSTATSPMSPGASNTPTSPSQTGGAGPSTPTGSLFVGSASTACKLPTGQHGQSVHGSIDVSQAGAGARLEVRLLASGASLASAGDAASRLQVGRLVRTSIRAGVDRFTVSLDAKARRALHARGHLLLIVEVRLARSGSTGVTLTRTVILRA
jgi:hypothetical protein